MSGVRHGTMNAYKHHRCRCDDCRDAQHDYYIRNREKICERTRRWVERNRERVAENQRIYNERLKRGEVVLPELDWAICERGGTQAQAKAHRRRGEKPCVNCLAAESRAKRERRQSAAGHRMIPTDDGSELAWLGLSGVFGVLVDLIHDPVGGDW